jgi:hypothetical protein
VCVTAARPARYPRPTAVVAAADVARGGGGAKEDADAGMSLRFDEENKAEEVAHVTEIGMCFFFIFFFIFRGHEPPPRPYVTA